MEELRKILSLENYYSIVLLIAFVFLALNIIACLIVKPRGRHRCLFNYSFLNLFIASLSSIVGSTVRFTQDNGITKFVGPWKCGVVGMFIRASISVVPFTAMAIFHELQLSVTHPRRFALNVFVITWAAALVLALPLFWTYHYYETDENDVAKTSPACRQAVSKEWKVFYLLYEVLVVVSECIVPSTYMLYALRKMGFIIEFLYCTRTVPGGMESKIRRIRLVFFHMLVFLLSWIPIGILILVRLFAMSEKEWFSTQSRTSSGTYTIIARPLFLSYLALQPIIYLYAYNDLTFTSRIFYLCYRKEKVKAPQADVESNIVRFETVGKTDGNESFS